jgi:hypothetical protein
MLVVILGFWAFFGKTASKPKPEPSLASLRAEIAALRLPAGTTRSSPAREEARIGSVLVTEQFVVQQSAAEARDFFRTELATHGWQHQSGADGPSWSDTYCKQTLAARLAPLQQDAATQNIELSLSWNQLSLLLCGG